MSRVRTLAALVLAVAGCGGTSGDGHDDGDAVSIDAGSAGLDAGPPPSPPPGLTRWIVGDPADRVTRSRAGVLLEGGGYDVDAAFAWQRDRIGGGDVVVLRASGEDGYNDYLYAQIGGVDSVETLLVDTPALAREPYVAWAIDHAEAVFLAGGDQAVYVETWRGTPVQAALDRVWARGGVLGGTSAGTAVLGGIVFAAAGGSLSSGPPLADPYDPDVTLVNDFLAVPPLAGVLTDDHFAARDRMGRLLAFLARAITDGWATRPVGLGIDEDTALVIDEHGVATVLGDGAVYAITPTSPPATCRAGRPLAWSNVPIHALRAGATITLPAGTTRAPATPVSAADGRVTPADPY